MKDWILGMSIDLYGRGKKALRDMKGDERGVSGIVVAVLLVLFAVLAATFFWEQISAFLKAQWEKINQKEFNEIGSGYLWMTEFLA